MRSNDRYHQHRRTVARNAADAVLVDHRPRADLLVPVEPPARVDHRLREVKHLVTIELELIGRHDERSELDLGVARTRDIANDRPEVLAREPFTADLAMQCGDRFRRFGVLHRRAVSIGHAESFEGFFTETQLALTDDACVVDDVEHRQDRTAIGLHLDLGECLEASGPHDGAIAVQVGHVLPVGIDAHPRDLQLERRHRQTWCRATGSWRRRFAKPRDRAPVIAGARCAVIGGRRQGPARRSVRCTRADASRASAGRHARTPGHQGW